MSNRLKNKSPSGRESIVLDGRTISDITNPTPVYDPFRDSNSAMWVHDRSLSYDPPILNDTGIIEDIDSFNTNSSKLNSRGNTSVSLNYNLPVNKDITITFGESKNIDSSLFIEQEQLVRITANNIFNTEEEFKAKVYDMLGLSLPDSDEPTNNLTEEALTDSINRNINLPISITGRVINPVDNGTDTNLYQDYSFKINLPYNKEQAEVIEKNIGMGVSKALIEHKYNFYIKKYENYIADSSILQDELIPNLYILLLESKNRDLDTEIGLPPTNKFYFDFTTLAGRLPENIIRPEMLRDDSTQNINDGTNLRPTFSSKQYFDLWTKMVPRTKRRIKDSLALKMKNVLITSKDISLLNTFSAKKRLFPMYTELSFTADRSNQFYSSLKNSGMEDSFMWDVVNHFTSLRDRERRSDRSENKKKRRLTSFTNNFKIDSDSQGNKKILNTRDIIEQEHNMFDINCWWNNAQKILDTRELNDCIEKVVLEDEHTFLGEYSDKDIRSSQSPETFEQNIRMLLFIGHMRNIIQDRVRTFEEIFNGSLSYSETIFYKIEKFRVDINTNEVESTPIQTYWLSNPDTENILTYVDTQIKYNSRYKYTIKAYELVVGSEYKYGDVEFNTVNSKFEAEFKVRSKPSLRIIEVPFFEYDSMTVIDDPPLPPEIEVISYKGIDNEISFNINKSYGQILMKEEIILEEDIIKFNNIRESRGLKDSDNIIFKSDDINTSYEIFRLDYKPNSYLDFKDSKRTFIDTDVDINTIQIGTNAEFIDTISPNTKYWYLFRSIDVHNNISNPSLIYQIELVNDAGAIYPLIRVFDFDSRREKKPSIEFRRTIQILPKFSQKVINKQASGLPSGYEDLEEFDISKIKLGLEDQTIWGKTFKIRLTGKSTGRKIDLNVTFSIDRIK